MKASTSFAFAAALLGVLPFSAGAREKAPIVVTAPEVSINQWSTRVGRALDQNLGYPLPIVGAPHEGVVAIQFVSGADGSPIGVTVARSSGSRDLDYAALRSVRQIKSLHPLPDGIAPGQVFQANILFANSERSRERQMATLMAEAKQNNSRFAARSAAVALNIGLISAAAR